MSTPADAFTRFVLPEPHMLRRAARDRMSPAARADTVGVEHE